MTDEELIRKYLPRNEQSKALEKLQTGYPVQYIIGNVEFYDTFIKVNENVLIPRFETEYLVEKTIKYLNVLNIKKPQVLEIGTGSGCISIALKKHLDCHINAIDINPEAIKLATENAKINKVDINFKVTDIHDYKSDMQYDLIISNPPYVPFNSEVDEKIKYEPQNAIYADLDGLYFYKIILDKIKFNLANNYLIAFEIGENEGYKVKQIAHDLLPEAYVKIENDYNNHNRYVFISKQKI